MDILSEDNMDISSEGDHTLPPDKMGRKRTSSQKEDETIPGSSSQDDEYDPFQHRQIEKPNSSIGTLIHMIKASLGTGIMAMPLAFKNGGLIFGTFGAIVICIIYAHCVHLLVGTSQKACKNCQVPLLGFSETVHMVLSNGPTKLKPFTNFTTGFVDVMILFQSFLSSCLFLVFIAKSFHDVFYNQLGIDWDTRIYILIILVPAVIITQIRELKYLVPFSLISNAFLVSSVCITLYFIFSEPISLTNRNLWPQWSTLPSFVSAVLFAIQGVRFVLPVENKMKHPQYYLSTFGVLNSAMAFLIPLYSVTGFFGYAQYGETTKGSVTLNLPSESALAESTRLLSGIGILFTLGFSYYVPMEVLWHHIRDKLSLKWHNWGQVIIRFTILIILAAVAIGAPEIEPFVGLVGSFGSATLAILIPTTLDMIFRWPNDFGKMNWILWKNVVLLVFGMFVLVTGTYYSLMDIVAIYN
ncbi:proton-coupled amino acid transporter-like protein CG1139 [Ochlerotatus camptorhynchus]|uniref:proton-coupled amino acid transporter-like protein CG1139 n=1 Tax=Ochlerotatus camptorhynchus TaxID=644619 RepID=UPI0031CE6D5C